MKSLTTSTQNQAGTPKSRLLTCMVATTLLLALAIPALVVAQNVKALNYTILYAFTGADGTSPLAAVVQDSQGNLYGTTAAGGSLGTCNFYGAGCGVVFKLSPSGAQTVLHAFTGGTDGAEPMGTLLLGPGGNLYGTAYSGGDVNCVGGGSGGCGVLFKIDSYGNYSVLHTFESGAADGNGPRSLVQDSAGNLYGGTDFGGGGSACLSGQIGCGVVFKLDTNNQLTVLHSFTGQVDGSDPIGHPTLGTDGNIYGTTYQGGTLGQGVVFKLSPNPDGTWTESWTYNFTGGGDGNWPVSAVIRDDSGNLYGAASSGGIGGNGTVFKIDANGHETTLYSFTGADGSLPYGDLIRDQHGNLYGTTLTGGALYGGVVFKVNPTGKETLLHDFTTIAGGYAPYAGLFRDRNGSLYGTTTYGGDVSCGGPGGGCGLVFKLTACSTPFCQGGGD